MNEFSQLDVLPYYGSQKLLVKDHTTDDIVSAIKKNAGLDTREYDGVSDLFWKGDADKTARCIFEVLKKKVPYDVEGEEMQTVRSPGAIIHMGGGDCKHYASFIVGICDSLERQGHPIHAYYRFVSDIPGEDVHHVFAVVRDKETGKEYWVDPVLSRYNARPHFYEIKDVDMGAKIGELYRISGTDATYPGGPDNLPNVMGGIGKGKKKHTNIFKKLGQDIKNGVNEVKELSLKVGIAPARSSFLALVDFNMFNLASQLANTWLNDPAKKAKLQSEWKKMGGDVTKLRNAINNGLKHKAFARHEKPPQLVSGTHMIMTFDRKGRIRKIYSPFYTVPTYNHSYMHEPDDYGNTPRVCSNDGKIGFNFFNHLPGAELVHKCNCQGRGDKNNYPPLPRVDGIGCGGNAIGCLPVCAAALMALAAAVIAALSKFIHIPPKDQAAMTAAAATGAGNLVDAASGAIDNAAGADVLNPDGSVNQDATAAAAMSMPGIPGLSGATGIDPDTGNPTLEVHSVDSPQIMNAGSPTGDAGPIPPDDADGNTPDSSSQFTNADGTTVQPAATAPGTVEAGIGPDFSKITDGIKNFVEQNKMPIALGVGGVILYKVMSKPSGRRKKGLFSF